MAEVSSPNDEFVAESLEAYSAASDLAEDLPADHVGKLGLALNRSVFFYEIMNDKKQAIQIANEAFAGAYAKYDEDGHTMSDESANITQLIKDNLVLWSLSFPYYRRWGRRQSRQVLQ
ncbi:14-3-3 protein homolog 1-like [Octopus sinensis]|uniref:14-3-3 protein homolog 1-like n=1 Tax=Octopus sinensis TaxID=2607531 RepID=A0A6P7U3M5_9MOLL|nr:14-3-3 protein homolog 1-like [Octopus sinensis]